MRVTFIKEKAEAATPPQFQPLGGPEKNALASVQAGASLVQVLESLICAAEVAAPGMFNAVMLSSSDGKSLSCVAAPSLPLCFLGTLTDIPVGPESASCGTAVHRRQAVSVTDIATDPLWRFWRLDALQHGLCACWSQPIQGVQGEILGTFDSYFADKREPSLRQKSMLHLASGMAALAIENAMSERPDLPGLDAQVLQTPFQCLVDFRYGWGLTPVCQTLQEAGRLASAQKSDLLAQPVSSDKQVLLRTGELTELTQHLVMTQEEERARIAQQMHDEMGSLFTAAKFDVARLKSALGPLSPEIAARFSHFTDMLDQGIVLKRRIIEELRPSSLNSLGLVQTLEILINEFMRAHPVGVSAKLQAVQMEPAIELTIYRIVQEALANVAAHAHASQVTVELVLRQVWRDAGEVEVQVTDDGVGFDATCQGVSMLGLMSMHYRVQAQGGHFHVHSNLHGGTRVRAGFRVVQSWAG